MTPSSTTLTPQAAHCSDADSPFRGAVTPRRRSIPVPITGARSITSAPGSSSVSLLVTSGVTYLVEVIPSPPARR